jgi:hypothetical protein
MRERTRAKLLPGGRRRPMTWIGLMLRQWLTAEMALGNPVEMRGSGAYPLSSNLTIPV